MPVKDLELEKAIKLNEDKEAYINFIEALKTDATKRLYRNTLFQFLRYCNIIIAVTGLPPSGVLLTGLPIQHTEHRTVLTAGELQYDRLNYGSLGSLQLIPLHFV